MLTFTTPGDMRAWALDRRRSGRSIGLVPTMGALHAGHRALIDDAARRCDDVVVSIFVNPLQFNESTDFDSYPRPIDDDVAACRHAGVAAVYAPTAGEMYPVGFETRVVPGSLAAAMEGPMRPGHFEGVTTVVTKLFGAVTPDVAIFGQKDFQQLAIVRRMASDLDTGIDIVGHPIVREPDGLALSSRNVRLDAGRRAAATCVPRSLDAARHAALEPDATVASVLAAASRVVTPEPLARIEYTTLFDPVSLAELDRSAHIAGFDGEPDRVRVATAVWFGDVRLIDNCDLLAVTSGVRHQP